MKSIGLAVLRRHFSAAVREVKSGEELVVTERGEPVGWLLPEARTDPPSLPADLASVPRFMPPRRSL